MFRRKIAARIDVKARFGFLSTPLALAACGSQGDGVQSPFDIPDTYSVAMRGNGATLSSATLGLDAQLTVSVASPPAHGTATQDGDGSVQYLPDTGYTGNDEIQVIISDDQGRSETVSVKLDIGGMGGAPIAAPDKFSVSEDAQFSAIAKYGVLANDFDESDLSAALLTAPAHGTVVLNNDGSYAYDPTANFNGQDSFTYTVTDQDGETDTTTVHILVTPVNDVPVAADYSTSGITVDMGATGQLLATDVDGDTLTYSLDQGPSNGTVTIYSNGSFEYTPDANFFGTDSFTYLVSDGNGGTNAATVTIGVDPSITSFGFQINGVDVLDKSGVAVAAAGDLNGDGIGDLVVGASFADPNGNPSAGETYVIFGSSTVGDGGTIELSSLSGNDGFVINGVAASDESGAAVAFAGDVNNDGIDDLIIGAPNAGTGMNFGAGEGYVVFGGTSLGASGSLDLSTLNGTNGFVMSGVNASDSTGYSVSFAGDVNADGIDDFIISARGSNLSTGASYVIFGDGSLGMSGAVNLAALNGNDGFVINGLTLFSSTGSSVSNAGDVNADGIDDFIISAPSANTPGAAGAGATYVIFGDALLGAGGAFPLGSLNGSNGFVVNGIDVNDQSGLSVSSAGDMNGDGTSDILIGAFLADANGITNSGESYVVFGGSAVGASGTIEASTLNGTNGFVINGIDFIDAGGSAVSSAGDVNGDGFDDILLNAYYADPNGNSEAGESYLIFGGSNVGSGGFIDLSSLNGTNGYILNGIDPSDRSSFSVSSAGDVNGDGIDDIIIGALQGDPNGNADAGESYVVFGGTDQLTAFDLADGQLDGQLDLSLLANPPF